MKRIILTALVFAGVFIANKSYADVPEYDAFFQSEAKDIYTDNAAIAFFGLFAPQSVGMDSYNWAKISTEKSISHLDELKKEMPFHSMKELKSEEDRNLFQSHINKMLDIQFQKIADSAKFNGDVSEADCWRKDGANGHYPHLDCLKDGTQLSSLNQKNTLLLARYEKIYNSYNSYIALPISNDMPSLISLEKIYIANLISLSFTDPEAALQKWIKNARFKKVVLSSDIDFIGRASFIYGYKQLQYILPVIIKAKPELARKYQAELLQILLPFGPKQMNLPLAFKGEYKKFKLFYDLLDEEHKAEIYNYAKDYINLSEVAAKDFDKNADEFERRNKNDRDIVNIEDKTTHLILAPYKDLLADRLIGQMEIIDALNRALDLYVQMMANNIKSKDVTDYLKKSPKSLYDPYTDQPFHYDDIKHEITLESIKNYNIPYDLN